MLTGQRVVVAGGTSGIGLAVAALAAAEGAGVTVASRSPANVTAAVARLGGRAEGRVLDTASESSVREFVANLERIDHLVVTAATAVHGRLADTDLRDIERYVDHKLLGTLRLVKHTLPRIAPGGSITLFSGASGRRASPGFAFGSAVNAGMDALGQSLAAELAPIRVNVVRPGIIDTPVWGTFLTGDARQQVFADTARRIPARRVGRADEVADAVLFLLRNAYVTGTVLTVDGGYLVS